MTTYSVYSELYSIYATALQAGRSRVRFPIVSLDFFHWHNPSDRTIALGLTQFHVPIVIKSGSLSLLEPLGPVQACNGIVLLPLTLYTHVVSTVCKLRTLHGMAKWTHWKICISFCWFLKFLYAMRKGGEIINVFVARIAPRFDPHLIASWLQLCFLVSSSVTLLLQRFWWVC